MNKQPETNTFDSEALLGLTHQECIETITNIYHQSQFVDGGVLLEELGEEMLDYEGLDMSLPFTDDIDEVEGAEDNELLPVSDTIPQVGDDNYQEVQLNLPLPSSRLTGSLLNC